MKQYLAVYMGADGKAKAMPDNETIMKAMAAWGQWMQDHAKDVVVMGGPLGKTKRTDLSGVSDIKNLMTGYVIVQAESHEAAARMFEKHPHFAMFPGECVEIMECLPIPTA